MRSVADAETSMLSAAVPRRAPAGVTLLEVVLAMGILATAIIGVISLFVTSEHLSVIAREESIALAAAEEVINEMRATPFGGTGLRVSDYHNLTRHVQLTGTEAPVMYLGRTRAMIVDSGKGPDGWKVDDELGVIMINQESPLESDFGDVDGDGDLDFPVDLNLNGSYTDLLNVAPPGTTVAFPMDLGGDAGNLAETLDLSIMRLIPVAVVVRWTSLTGLERRVQILTFIGDRLAQY